LAVALTFLAFVLTIETSEQTAMTFIAVHCICWVLLGFGLWFSTEEMPTPALSA
jgi:hypothetical protein